MTPAAIPQSRAWTGEGGLSVSTGEALTSLRVSRASSVRLLGFFCTPLDRTLCVKPQQEMRQYFFVEERTMRIAGTVRIGGGIYELLGAAGAAAGGAEDGDGAGEEDAGGCLERGGVVVEGEERRGAELDVPLAIGLAGTSASVWGLRRGHWR
jgi:hypothetical protein